MTAIPSEISFGFTPYEAADGSELVGQVAAPLRPDGGSVPAVVFFHGGSWRSRRRAASFDQPVLFFAHRGLVAVSATYRGLDSGASSLDDCVADARATVQWVRSMPNVDASRVVVGGHSAGGHLALCLALFRGRNELPPEAVIGLSPAVACSVPHLSPIEHVGPGAPPVLILQGARDPMTTPAFAQRFTDRMVAAGNECHLELVDGAHSFYAFREQTYTGFRHALRSMDRFLVERGYLRPSPDVESAIDDLGTPPPPRPRRNAKA